MKFQTAGDAGKPIMVMLTGSFCPSSCLRYLCEKLQDTYRMILPEYNGHYAGTAFTTRQNEAAEVARYLRDNGIDRVQVLYGQSMGAEVGIELYRQLLVIGIEVAHCFWDGAPCTRLPYLFRKVMYRKFKAVADMMRKDGLEGVLQKRSLQKFTNGGPEALRPVLAPLAETVPFLTNETIRNETECCYTFDFPAFDEAAQRKMQFFYATGEKAYRLCCDGVKKAYPQAVYTLVDGYGHLTYSIKETDKYAEMLKALA